MTWSLARLLQMLRQEEICTRLRDVRTLIWCFLRGLLVALGLGLDLGLRLLGLAFRLDLVLWLMILPALGQYWISGGRTLSEPLVLIDLAQLVFVIVCLRRRQEARHLGVAEQRLLHEQISSVLFRSSWLLIRLSSVEFHFLRLYLRWRLGLPLGTSWVPSCLRWGVQPLQHLGAVQLITCLDVHLLVVLQLLSCFYRILHLYLRRLLLWLFVRRIGLRRLALALALCGLLLLLWRHLPVLLFNLVLSLLLLAQFVGALLLALGAEIGLQFLVWLLRLEQGGCLQDLLLLQLLVLTVFLVPV